jgi:hypothetical protein
VGFKSFGLSLLVLMLQTDLSSRSRTYNPFTNGQ